MLLDIFVDLPSLLMTNIAWYIRVGLVLICLIVLFAVAIGALSFYRSAKTVTRRTAIGQNRRRSPNRGTGVSPWLRSGGLRRSSQSAIDTIAPIATNSTSTTQVYHCIGA